MELSGRYTDAQLLQHLAGLGQWTAIRAGELRSFTEHLAVRLAEAGDDPQKLANLRYGLKTYVDAVQEMVTRCREAQEELGQRGSPPTGG